ncbi:MAG: DUF2333 family protein [Thiohalocapsa sp.]|uniref:DUF2333 family protein n=1 Tax=Thiohalocapsa sp. TaxID=2497641 RepID=UPI0025F23586|nr:DUF2333 family protein [Thiohalocapsa sp.]MCG6940011.1 DUF2333 family protein [Thiohalocapsa sp.]
MQQAKKTSPVKRFLAWFTKQTVLLSGLMIGIPVLLAALWIGVLIWVWDTPEINASFHDPANAKLSRSEKGALLAEAITYQFRRRLGDQGNWVPNDLVIAFDRNAACAAGVKGEPGGIWYVTTEIFEAFADRTARIGGSSQDDSRLTNAAKKFNYDPRRWGLSWLGGADSQHEYALGMQELNDYLRDLRAGQAVSNVRADDLAALLAELGGQNGPMDKIYSRLLDAEKVPPKERRQRVYSAICASAVSADTLSAIRSAYATDFEEDALAALDKAIKDLYRVSQLYPPVVLNGADDSLWLVNHARNIAAIMSATFDPILDAARSLPGGEVAR